MPTKSVSPESDELLQEVANHLLKSRKVVVITGAGISTNSGIPDFRSENGLYSLIQAQLDAAEKHPDPEDGANDNTSGSQQQQVDPSHDARPSKQGRLSKDAAGASQSVSRTVNIETRLSRVKQGATRHRSPLSRTASVPATENNTPRTRSRKAASLPPDRQENWSQTPALVSSDQDATRVGGANEGDECARRRSPRRARSTSPPSSSPTKKSVETPHKGSQAPSQRVSQLSNSAMRERSGTRRAGELAAGSSPLSSPPLNTGHSHLNFSRNASNTRCTPSRLTQAPILLNSSPLSSPPPILFDPYDHPSSSTSQQDSSENGSTATSETDETPPSSMAPVISSHGSKRSSLPNMKGRDMFDVSIWADPLRTSVFYTFATTLRQKARDVEPTSSHRFISHLRDRGKLVRCYTQNIDQIEEKVGLSTSLQQGPGQRGRFSRKSLGGAFSAATVSKDSDSPSQKPPTLKSETSSNGVECVFLHGSLQSLRCFLCGRVCEWDENNRSQETLFGRQPECPHCVGAAEARVDKGKRALGVGKLRPDIVLYGEEHPNAHLIDPIVNHDLGLSPDFLLILGTSLKVHGLKRLVREFAKTIHCRGGKVVFVNLTKPPESSWGDIIDYWIEWDCDAWVSSLQERIPLMWLPPGTKLPAPAKKKRQSTGEGRVAAKKRECSGGNKEAGPTATKATDVVGEPKMQVQQELEGKLAPAVVPKHKSTSTSGKQNIVAKVPQRPACIREDRFSAAFLTWQISRDLRRISGNDLELELLSSVQNASSPSATSNLPGASDATSLAAGTTASSPSRKTGESKSRNKRALKSARKSLPNLKHDPDTEDKPKKAKKARTRKSAPGWVYVSIDEDEADEKAVPEVKAGESEEQSILAAVKSNPRKRKRKVIDGMEITLPATGPRAESAKATDHHKSSPTIRAAVPLPRKLPQPIVAGQVSPHHNKENDLIVSPKIMSDLNRVSMNTLDLPPIRPTPRHQSHQKSATAQQRQDQEVEKPAPLEPQSPPSGPLATIAPNVAAARGRPLAASRAYQAAAALRPCPPTSAPDMYSHARFKPFHHQYLPPRTAGGLGATSGSHAMPPTGYASQAYPAAFSYFDALVHQLRVPPFGGAINSWTPEAQLKLETDEAAAALSQLRTEGR